MKSKDKPHSDVYQGEPRFKSGWWILPAVVMGLAIIWGLV